MTDPDLRARLIADLVAAAAEPAAPLVDAGRGLRDHELVLLPSPRDMARYLEELSDKVGPNLEHYGEVRASDAPAPTLMGAHGPDGFVVSVFTSDEIARERAVTIGALEPTTPLMFSPRRWLSALREFRAEGHAGLVVDEGTPHRVALDRAGLERLWMALERDRIDAAADLLAVTRGGQLHTERRPDGFVYAFAFVGETEAALSMAEMTKSGPFETAARTKTALAEELRARGVDRLEVDHGFPHQFVLTRDEFLPLLGGAAEPAPAGAPAVDPALGALAAADAGAGAASGDTLADLAAAGPDLPPLPPAADDVASRRTFQTWRKQAD